MRTIFSGINESAIFKKLAKEDSICADSYKLLCHFASITPFKPVEGAGFTDECAETMRDVYTCIQKFYLDHTGSQLQIT